MPGRSRAPAVPDAIDAKFVEVPYTEGLAKPQTTRLKQIIADTKPRLKRAAEDVFVIGKNLIEAKAIVGHGHFGKFLKAEFEMTERTAQNFMRVAETFKCETVSDLGAITLRALYLLAGAPEDARKEAISRAAAGETVTLAVARQITGARPRPDPKPEDFHPPAVVMDPHNGFQPVGLDTQQSVTYAKLVAKDKVNGTEEAAQFVADVLHEPRDEEGRTLGELHAQYTAEVKSTFSVVWANMVAATYKVIALEAPVAIDHLKKAENRRQFNNVEKDIHYMIDGLNELLAEYRRVVKEAK